MIKILIATVTAAVVFALIPGRRPDGPATAVSRPDRSELDALEARERELIERIGRLENETAALKAAAVTPVPAPAPAPEPPLEEFLAAVDWDGLARTTIEGEGGSRGSQKAIEAAWAEARRIRKELDRRGLGDAGAVLMLPPLLLARNRLGAKDPAVDQAVLELARPLSGSVEEAAAKPASSDNELRLRGLEIQEDFLRRVREKLPNVPLPQTFSYVDMEGRDPPAAWWKRQLGLKPEEEALIAPDLAAYASGLKGAYDAGDMPACMRHRVALQKTLLDRFGADPGREQTLRKDSRLTIFLDVVVTRYDREAWTR